MLFSGVDFWVEWVSEWCDWEAVTLVEWLSVWVEWFECLFAEVKNLLKVLAIYKSVVREEWVNLRVKFGFVKYSIENASCFPKIFGVVGKCCSLWSNNHKNNKIFFMFDMFETFTIDNRWFYYWATNCFEWCKADWRRLVSLHLALEFLDLWLIKFICSRLVNLTYELMLTVVLPLKI